ncbi:alkylhydroperoxidase like protein, AhpD family [Dehalogenimonas lykanthroporepellens BL-DC-9]|jgi:AhpD family alkylhydroperoxidase|nr:alkylhydroperoxidase like protein, AhpD family [Dehalogenimonas lykanthroporepellens BL-DC-9]
MIDNLNQEQSESRVEAGPLLEEIRQALGMVPNFFQAQADADPAWLELNWKREKAIMLAPGALDRKTRELIALTVSLTNRCQYCSLAHETMALMTGATREEIIELKKVVELFSSFNAIADSLQVPCDVTPSMLDGR